MVNTLLTKVGRKLKKKISPEAEIIGTGAM